MTLVQRLAPGERLDELDVLYRRVFGLAPTDSGMNPRLLIALTRAGGQVVGALDAGTLVGYGLVVLARDSASGELYHYNQTVAVDAAYRGHGVGRAIMVEQGRLALAEGITTMRWAFDPVQARNAHLNLDVLGGEVRRFVRDLYGTAAPGNDAGERTDRAIVTWALDAPPRIAPPPPRAVPAGVTLDVGDDALLGIPADWSAYRSTVGADATVEIRDRVAAAFETLLARGLVASACGRVDEAVAVYRFTPAE